MTALTPATCSIPAHTAAKVALVRRVEAAARANAEREEAPRGQQPHSLPPAPHRKVQPTSALAAHILGARDGYANESGYGAYARASQLLSLESRVVDLTRI